MYTIQEVCEKTGLSAHTLRYYEKEGLLTDIQRSQGGFRQYSDENLERLGLICCLKNTGMPLHEIARFLQLSRQGDSTLEERVQLLKSHRAKIIERMDEMQQYLNKITWKVNFFSEKLQVYRAEEKAKR
jgi:DNA-binding transcriptional MerR regulator